MAPVTLINLQGLISLASAPAPAAPATVAGPPSYAPGPAPNGLISLASAPDYTEAAENVGGAITSLTNAIKSKNDPAAIIKAVGNIISLIPQFAPLGAFLSSVAGAGEGDPVMAKLIQIDNKLDQ